MENCNQYIDTSYDKKEDNSNKSFQFRRFCAEIQVFTKLLYDVKGKDYYKYLLNLIQYILSNSHIRNVMMGGAKGSMAH